MKRYQRIFSDLTNLPHQHSWWYDVADMSRRLSLTCGTLLFTHVNHFLLFSISVSCLSLAVHTELTPYKHAELNSLAAIQHWQNLLCLITMMIRDANMYQGTEYELIGGCLLVCG